MEAPKQRSRSIGLAEQTGKSRTEGTDERHRSVFPRAARRFLEGKKATLDRTCVEGTAEVGAAVALAPARAACLSSGCVAAALAPHAQLVVAALLILGARLGKEEKTRWDRFNVTVCVLGFS